jgi:hypothetical protein
VLLGGIEMNIKQVLLSLTPQDTLRLTRILLDDDKYEALAFLRECIKLPLDKVTRDH